MWIVHTRGTSDQNTDRNKVAKLSQVKRGQINKLLQKGGDIG